MDVRMSQLSEAWQLAIRREQELHDYYARMAQSVSESSAQTLFAELAAEAIEHRRKLEIEYQHRFEQELRKTRGEPGCLSHPYVLSLQR
jgi:rubrerythrin